MQNSESNSGQLAVIAVTFVMFLATLAGGFFLWQRQKALDALQAEQQALVAATEEEKAAVAENVLANSETSEPQQPLASNGNTTQLEESIRQVLQSQQRAWNAGDIDQFMESYWKSEELTFSSGGKVTRGWQATLEGYKKRYSSRQQMGILAFSELEISSLADDAALVLGEWRLTREADEPGGKFSLVFRRFDGQWLIVHDHTSSFATK